MVELNDIAAGKVLCQLILGSFHQKPQLFRISNAWWLQYVAWR